MSAHIILLLTFYVIINDLQASYYPDNYIGCFEDKGFLDDADRILPVQLPESDSNSQQECGKACKNDGYILAGTENGDECFCGNTMKDYEKVEDTECDEICTGNEDEYCGGGWRISIYNISQMTHQTSTQVSTTQSTSSAIPVINISSVIPITNTLSSELVETTLTTLAIYNTSLDEYTNMKTVDMNVMWLVYIIVPVVLVAALAAITVIILKRRRKQKDVLPEVVYAAGGSTQDLYENDTVFDDIVENTSKKQASNEHLEMEQYSHVVKSGSNTATSDDSYNFLSLKTTNIPNRGQENMNLLDNTYSHLSDCQSETDQNTLTGMYSHIESKQFKTISASEDSYDRLI